MRGDPKADCLLDLGSQPQDLSSALGSLPSLRISSQPSPTVGISPQCLISCPWSQFVFELSFVGEGRESVQRVGGAVPRSACGRADAPSSATQYGRRGQRANLQFEALTILKQLQTRQACARCLLPPPCDAVRCATSTSGIDPCPREKLRGGAIALVSGARSLATEAPTARPPPPGPARDG